MKLSLYCRGDSELGCEDSSGRIEEVAPSLVSSKSYRGFFPPSFLVLKIIS